MMCESCGVVLDVQEQLSHWWCCDGCYQIEIAQETLNFPIITLTNGIKVMNMNSPHPFTFEDGSILPAVPEDIAKSTQLDSEDIESFNGKFTVVEKRFVMSPSCKMRVTECFYKAVKYGVDVILTPLPVLLLLKDKNMHTIFYSTFVTDRISKKISIDKFCQ